MDKFVKILRVILVFFFLIWIISWSSIRAFKSVEKGNSGLYNKMMVELYNTPYAIKKWFRSKEIVPHNAKKIKGVIAILTGGGDVPGLNPAIRAIYGKD